MRAYVRFAAVWLLAAGLAAFAGPPDPKKFAGTWEAKAKGTVFLVLKITAGDKISGTMKSGPVQLDEKGDLVEAGPPVEDENPIFFTKVVEDEKLDFNCQDSEDNVLQFELKLTGDDSAELRIIDKDHPDLKPFSVRRAKA
jgi:hypothetical protein